MRIYVASSFKLVEKVKSAVEALEEAGHEITVKWWAQIQRGLVYLALCIVAVGWGFWMSSRFEPLRGTLIVLATLMLGAILVDSMIKSEIVPEEEN